MLNNSSSNSQALQISSSTNPSFQQCAWFRRGHVNSAYRYNRNYNRNDISDTSIDPNAHGFCSFHQPHIMVGSATPSTTYFTGSGAGGLVMDTTTGGHFITTFTDSNSLSIDCAYDTMNSSSFLHDITAYSSYESTVHQPTLVHYYSPNSYVLCVQSSQHRSHTVHNAHLPNTEYRPVTSNDKVYVY